MTGDVVPRLEACTLPSEEFHHEQHLYVACSYLRELPLAAASVRFIENLELAQRGCTTRRSRGRTCFSSTSVFPRSRLWGRGS